MKTRTLRYSLLSLVLLSLVYLALGKGSRSFEAFCPFGGAESLWGLFRQGEFSCALGPLNLSMFIAVLALALVAKKVFCGWACPIGFLGELFGKLGNLVRRDRFAVGPRLNGGLKLLRYVALALSLAFTYKLGELVLRGFDPFYVLFSGMGHGTIGWITWATTGVIAAGALVVPMFFCRYLCPLGACFDPFSKLGLVKIFRNEASCTGCGDCGRACPQDLRPDEAVALSHRDCTNCLDCVDACPVEGSLGLRASLGGRR
jgi:polyferredoxin